MTGYSRALVGEGDNVLYLGEEPREVECEGGDGSGGEQHT